MKSLAEMLCNLVDRYLEDGYTVKVTGPDGKQHVYYPDDDGIDEDDLPFDGECDGNCDECDDPCDAYDEDEWYWGIPKIRDVIFNPPATIVYWEDGTKTVVKCSENDKFDRYTGFSIAVMKKLFGTTSDAVEIMDACDRANKSAPKGFSEATDRICHDVKEVASVLKGYPDLYKRFVESMRSCLEE